MIRRTVKTKNYSVEVVTKEGKRNLIVPMMTKRQPSEERILKKIKKILTKEIGEHIICSCELNGESVQTYEMDEEFFFENAKIVNTGVDK
jgi:hypothetical protein